MIFPGTIFFFFFLPLSFLVEYALDQNRNQWKTQNAKSLAAKRTVLMEASQDRPF